MTDGAMQFKLELDREWAAKGQEIGEWVQEIGLAALNGVVQMSPVDTGRFKGNWYVSIGGPVGTTSEENDPSGGATLSRGQSVIESYPDDDFPQVWLQNNLPYAVPLELGHSSQARGGMVGLTVANVEAFYSQRQI